MKKTPALTALRNEVFDTMVTKLNRNSKFYSQDCDELWAGISKRSESELRETLSRQRAISRTTQREINLHCQF